MRRLFVLLLCGCLTACPGPLSEEPQRVDSARADQDYTFPLDVGNGQVMRLEMQLRGEQISGHLVVEPGLQTQMISHTILAGRYAFTGGFSPPRGFLLSGEFPPPGGPFHLTGTLPTETEAGAYQFSQGGETATGVLPPFNTYPSPAPQPTVSSSPLGAASPFPPATATPRPERQWTEAELEAIRDCANQVARRYQGTDLGQVLKVSAKISANLALVRIPNLQGSAQSRQQKLNEAGELAWSTERLLNMGCVESVALYR